MSDLTMAQALYSLAGLRRHGFNDRQVAAWSAELDEWPPEVVLEYGRRLARSWKESGDWMLGDLRAYLPPAKPTTAPEGKAFTWDCVTGGFRGNWAVFDRLGEDERLAIALHLLASCESERWMEHEATATRMHPEAVSAWRMLREKAIEGRRRAQEAA